MSALTAILSAAAVLALAQVEAGNRAYRRGGVEEAVAAYRRAVEKKPDDAAARYNLGTAYLADGRADAALPHLARATEAEPPELRARAFYNLGTAHLSRAADGDRESALRAVDAFRQALLLQPEDRDAKWNLELALRRLEEPPAPKSPE
ncbi:MAG: tetratricopeptide repeat protein, partial [Gemmatimonadota bacterium]